MVGGRELRQGPLGRHGGFVDAEFDRNVPIWEH